ncbi:MAG: glycoside hydrolase family 13 protein [Betaproteobacteria bacterium]
MKQVIVTLTAALAATLTTAAQAQSHAPNANRFDRELAGMFEAREKDWRNGAIVYQVLVDRFAPPAHLDAKRHLYPAPKILRKWEELPTRGTYLPDAKVWSHEIDFWGGDLQSMAARLGHVQDLGADVLYLNPIHLAYTNHKYDALDYQQVSPEFGTRADLQRLAQDVHQRGMKLVLDGVFNHMGRNSPLFRQAEADPNSPVRDWFIFGREYPGGARSWWLAENLPELNLENPRVRDHIYAGPDSVVRNYLRDGIDGWRLDVAVDIGFNYLDELTRAAHREKPGSLVVGEIANYPKEWFPAVDAVMHFTLRHIMLRLADGRISPRQGAAMLERMMREADFEHLLKSWVYLDNHDTERLASALPNEAQRRLAQVLQFTLPGSPNLYYGGEVGMAGGDDPAMRAPMRWDLVTADNPTLQWTKQLIALRKQQRALRVGNFRLVTTDRLLGFERYTDRVRDTVIVLVNPGPADVTETVLVANSKLMNPFRLNDLLPTTAPAVSMMSSMLQVTVPAGSFRVLVPEVAPPGGYTSYKRVQ